MISCTCARVDGYRIRRISCPVHGEVDAARESPMPATIPAGQLTREHLGRRVEFVAHYPHMVPPAQKGDGTLTHIEHDTHVTVYVESADLEEHEIDASTPVTVWPRERLIDEAACENGYDGDPR